MELLLEVKQTQKLSPQVLQSMNILQMGISELQDYVEEILQENPALDLEAERKEDAQQELHSKVQWLMANDRQNRWYHREDSRDLIELAEDPSEESLYDYLRWQLDEEQLSGELGQAVDCVLSCLNDRGYLDETTEELAERCGQSVETVSRAEELVRGLEPAGVGARSLAECLALQLERKGERGLALILVRNHLEDIARDHYHHISKVTGASREEIQRACRQIRDLDPRPIARFLPRETPGYITPDLLVTEENGRPVITCADDFLPALRVSSYYEALMRESDEQEVRDYLTDKVRQADWVIKSIEQRKNTLLSCARIIVAHQEAFFRREAGELRPLTLSDVAAEAEVHESTVSRAIKDKYIQCVHGVFPMSHFFTRGLHSDSGESISAGEVKAQLRALIDGENKGKPLSDQKLCDLLAAQGLEVSRRTVAKYRDEMGIPAATGRKQF